MFATPFEKGCMLVLGGARSGKSGFALNVCNGLGRRRIFLATAQAGDDEMAARIRNHRAERGSEWRTIEAPLGIADRIRAADGPESVILLDCLTLWLSNLFMAHGEDQAEVEGQVTALCDVLSSLKGTYLV